MSFNKYLVRAARLKGDPLVSLPAKGAMKAMNFTDRVLGISARKMRTKADNAKEIISKLHPTGQGIHPGLDKIQKNTQRSADLLTRKSNSTRIKTGLVLGATGLAYKGLSNNQSDSASNYDYNQQYY